MSYPCKPLVIIPTYNERENISSLIPEILKIDSRLHVLIVDDGSPDGTAQEVLRLRNGEGGSRVHLHSRPGKLGLGSAYVVGFKWGLAVGYDFLIQMDADWSHNPSDLRTMLKLAEKADFVVGSRYVPGGGTLNWGAVRKMISRFGSLYSRLILGCEFADFTGGFNGWAGNTLKNVGLDDLRSDGYAFQIELKYRAHQCGFTHIEFPIIFAERRSGRSKMSVSILLEACWRVWKFRSDLGTAAARLSAKSERKARES